MLLSVSTSPMNVRLSDRKAIRIIKEAGFDAYDMSLFQLTRDENYEFNRADYVEIAKDLRK